MRKCVLCILFFVFCFLFFVNYVLATDPDVTPTPVEQKPVDNAEVHADKNPFGVRGYEPLADGKKKIFPFAHSIDTKAPQLSTLIEGNPKPTISNLYSVYDWNWNTNSKGPLIQTKDPKAKADYASAAGFSTTAGQTVIVPKSGYEFESGYSVVVLYATENKISIKYTPADSVANGYTVQLDNLTVNPKILELYNEALKTNRNVLPALPHGYVLGQTKAGELKIIMRDKGDFMDVRWKDDWWRDDQMPKPSLTPTPALNEPKLVKVAKEEFPGVGSLDLGSVKKVGPVRNYPEQSEEACSRLEDRSTEEISVPDYRDAKGKTEPEARTDAGLNYGVSVRGLHCGQAKGTPMVIQETSPFKLDMQTLCGEMRVREDISGLAPGKTGVWWAGEIGLNYQDGGIGRAFHLPFVEEMADIFAGSWDAEHMSEAEIEEKDNFLNNFSTLSGANSNPNDPMVVRYNKLKSEKDQKTGALKKLLDSSTIDVLKCGFVKYVRYKPGSSRYDSFSIDNFPLVGLSCPPIPAIKNDSLHRFDSLVYQGSYEDWENIYKKAWDKMPVVPNERVSGDIKFEVCEDREYLASQSYPEVMRFGLAANSLWQMKTPMGDPDDPKLGTQEYFYQRMGFEDMRDPLEYLLTGGIPYNSRKQTRESPMPTPAPFYLSPEACNFPRPEGDTGLVFHGPLSGYTNDWKGDFDKVMQLARDLKGRWMVMYPGDTGQAAFAAREAAQFGMMPIIRPKVLVDQNNIDWAGYVKAAQGSGFQSPYIQIFNEPGDDREWKSKSPDIYAFAQKWVQAAKQVVAAGGKPGLQVLSRSDFYAVLRFLPKDDPLWKEVWFSWHGYADNKTAPEQEATYEDDKIFLSILKWGDVFMDRLGFVPPTLTTEGGWEEKPPVGCAGSTATSGCVPSEAEKQRIADYNTRAYMDTLSKGVLPNGKPLPDYILGLNPAFILSNWGNDKNEFKAFAWEGEGRLFDWTPTINALKNYPDFQRLLECQKQQQRQQRQREMFERKLERMENLRPYLERLQKDLEKTVSVVFKIGSASFSSFWPRVQTAFAQTVENLNPFKEKKSTLLAQGGGQCFHIEMGIANKVVNSDGSIDFDLQSQLVFDGSKEGHVQLFVDGDSQTGISQATNFGTNIQVGGRRYDIAGNLQNNYTKVHVPNGGSVNKTVFAKVDECYPQYANENGTSCQFINNNGNIVSNCDGQLPSIGRPTSTSGCNSGTQCCLNQDCTPSCEICKKTQVPPSDTTVFKGGSHILIGVDWGQDMLGSSFIDPVRFRYKIPKHIPGQGVTGCKFTPYIVEVGGVERREAHQEGQPLPSAGPISCGAGGSGGGCPGNAPYCGPGWVCGDFDCEAQHIRVIDNYNNVPYLASGWMQIADPIWGFVSAYAKTNNIAGNAEGLSFDSLGDYSGCSIEQDKILDQYGRFRAYPAADHMSLSLNDRFGFAADGRPNSDFKWDSAFKIQQTSPADADSNKINFYKTGGICNASLWWSKKVLNPDKTSDGSLNGTTVNNSSNNTAVPATTSLPSVQTNPNAPVPD